MIRESLSRWDEPLNELLDYTSQRCLAMILERASCVFSLWHGTWCYDLLLKTCESFFQGKYKIQTSAAKRVLDTERQTALTLDETRMRTASEEVLKVLENAYRNERVKAFLTKINPEWHTNAEDRAKLDKMMSKVTDAQLGPNPYSKELKAMAVRAILPFNEVDIR